MILAVAFNGSQEIENHIIDTDLLPSTIKKQFILATQENKKVIIENSDLKFWEKLKKSYIDNKLPVFVQGAIVIETKKQNNE